MLAKGREELHVRRPLALSGVVNLLKPNDIYICRTAALTFRRYILNIYSTNIHTEYFKQAAYSQFFFFKMPFIS